MGRLQRLGVGRLALPSRHLPARPAAVHRDCALHASAVSYTSRAVYGQLRQLFSGVRAAAGGGERATRQQYRAMLGTECPVGSVLLYQLGNFYEILDECADWATKKVGSGPP